MTFFFFSFSLQILHIVLIPFFTAFYNIAAIVGLYPKLSEPDKQRLPHHLRFDNAIEAAPAGGVTTKSASDIASERRRAKALKVCVHICCIMWTLFFC
jgi:hypothetical protein